MKKKLITSALAISMAAASFAGCTLGTVEEAIDKTKKQIYVSVYNGGYGLEWLNKIKKDFERDNPNYQVMIGGTLDTDLYTGATSLNYNVYLTTTCYVYKNLVPKNLFADLTDIYEKTLPNETVAVKDKIHDYDQLKTALSYPGKTGIYAIPFTKSFTGFVYDHDLFKSNVDKRWLFAAQTSEKAAAEAQGLTVEERNGKLYFVSSTGNTNYEEGDVLLRAGKDGKYGTYDDGQPITLEEWNNMLAYIKLDSSRPAKPITYADRSTASYTPPILEAVIAQYEGLDNFELFYQYDGTYKHGTNEFAVTPEEGFKVYDMDGVQKGLEFFYDNLCRTDNIEVDSDSDHLTAQNKMLLWNQTGKTDYACTMLVDGVWWENEARPTIEALYEWGERDFRYMLFPEMEGQYGIDGEGNGSVFSAQDYGLTLVANKGGDEMVNMSKKFVEYLIADENLVHFTEQTGVTRPFTYEMNDASINKLTKFGKTVYDIMQDTENVRVVVPQLLRYETPLGFATELNSHSFTTQVHEAAGLGTYRTPTVMGGARVKDVATYLSGMKEYYQSNWSKFYKSVEELYQK